MSVKTDQLQGKVEEISLSRVGAELLEAAPAGSVTLVVESIADFSEYGGRLIIDDDPDPEDPDVEDAEDLPAPIYYLTVDEEASTITLLQPLATAIPAEAFIWQAPRVMEKVAIVRGDENEDSVTCRIDGSIEYMFEEGVRAVGQQETVLFEIDGDDEYVITDKPGESPIFRTDKKTGDKNWDFSSLWADLDELYNDILPQLQIDLSENQEFLDELNLTTLPQLQADLSVNQQALANLNGVVLPGLSAELAAAQQELATLGTNVSDFGTDLSSVENDLAYLNNTALPHLQNGIDTVQGNVNTVQGNVATVNSNLNAVFDRVVVSEGEIETLTGTTLPSLNSALSSAQGELNTLNNTIVPGINSQIGALGQENTSRYNEIVAAKADITTLYTVNLPNITTILNGHEASLNTLNNTSLPNLQSSLGTAQQELSTLKTVTIPGVQSSVQAVSGDVYTLQQTTANLGNVVIPDIQGDLSGLTGRFPIRAADVGFTMGGANLWSNSSFENINDFRTDWNVYSNDGTAGIYRGVGEGRNGGDCAALVWFQSSQQTQGLFRSAPTQSGIWPTDWMVLSFYARAQGTGGTNMNGATFATRHNVEPQFVQWMQNPPLGPEWQRYAVKFKYGANVSDFIFWGIDQYAGGFSGGTVPPGAYQIDDIQLEMGEVPTAYAPKPDEILPGTVGDTHLSVGSVTTEKMTAGTINGDRIAGNTLDANRIIANTISTNQIAANAVNGDRIAANTLHANRIIANTITGDKIAANAITARELTVASRGDNLVKNPLMTDLLPGAGVNDMPIGWANGDLSGGREGYSEPSPSGWPTGRVIVTKSMPSKEVYTVSDRFPVAQGKTYSLSALMGYEGSGAPYVYFRLTFFDKNANYISYVDILNHVPITNGASSSGPIERSGQATAPAGAASAMVEVYNFNSAFEPGGVYLFFSNVAVREVILSARIANGAITADKVQANAITANKLNVVMGGGNMLRDSSFEGPDIMTQWFWKNGAGTAQRLPAENRAGYYARLHSAPSADSWIEPLNPPTLEGGKKYVISALVYRATPTNSGGNRLISVHLPNEAFNESVQLMDGTVVDRSTIPLGVWTRIKVGVSPSKTYGPGQWELRVYAPTTGFAEFLGWDHIQVEEGDVPTAWSPKPDEILPGTIVGNMVQADTITGDKILAESVYGNRIIANTMGAERIVAGSITTDRMTANTISGDRITSNTLHADKIVANTITGDKIQANAITAEKLTVGSLGDELIPNNRFADRRDEPGWWWPRRALGWTQSGVGPGYNQGYNETHQAYYFFSGTSGGDLGSSIITEQFFPVMEGVTYATTAEVLYEGSGFQADFRVIWYDQNKGYLTYTQAMHRDTQPSVPGAGSGFTARWSNQITAPANARYGRMEIVSDPTQAHLYSGVREVSMRRVTVSAQIANGAITADKIVANAITADKIQASAITTEKLSISTMGDNLIPNGKFIEGPGGNEMPAGWVEANGNDGNCYREVNGYAPNGVQLVLYSQARDVPSAGTTNYGRAMSRVFPVSPGKTYNLEGLFAQAGANQGLHFGIAWWTYNPGDASPYETDIARADVIPGATQVSTTFEDATSWTRVGGQVTAPANARFGRVVIYNFQPGQAGYVLCSDIAVRQVTGSSQIANGAITTDKMVANTITGDRITANTLHGDKIMVNTLSANRIIAASITADKIAAGAITADKITVASRSDSLIANGNFVDRNPDGTPMGWVVNSYGHGGTINPVNVYGYDHYGSFTTNAGGGFAAFQNTADIPCVPGDQFYLDVGIGSYGGGHSAEAILYFYTREGNYITAIGAGLIATSDNAAVIPVHKGGVVTAPPGASYFLPALAFNAASMTYLVDKYTVSKVNVSARIADGAITADKVRANAITANKLNVIMGGGNLVPYSNFQDGAGGASLSLGQMGWNFSGTGGGAYPSNNVAYRGAWSALVVHGAGTNACIYKDIDGLKPGQKYTISCYVYAESNLGAHSLVVHDTTGANGATTYSTVLGDVKHRLVIRGWTATNTGRIRIHMYVGEQGKVGNAYFDCVQLEEGEYETAYAPKTDEILPGTIVANMITAGVINTDHMTSNTINGDRITANTLHANKIIANTITADKIAANSITAEKLTVGTLGENLAVNPRFADQGASASEAYGWTSIGKPGYFYREVNPGFPGGVGGVLRGGDSSNIALFGAVQTVTFPAHAGTSYSLALDVGYAGAMPVIQAEVVWLDSAGGVVDSEAFVYESDFSNSGQTLRKTFGSSINGPTGTVSGRIRIYNVGPDGSYILLSRVLVRPSVISAEIKDGAITGDKIIAGAITTAKLTANSINGDRITAGTLNADKITANTFYGSQIVAGTISGNSISANTMSGDRIIANTFNGDRIVANTINGDRIVTNTLHGDRIIGGTISAGKLAANAIDGFTIRGVNIYSGYIQTKPENGSGGGVTLSGNGIDMTDANNIVRSSISNGGTFSGVQAFFTGTAQVGGVLTNGVRINTPTTTGTAANATFDTAGNLLKFSSSARYKTNIRPLEMDEDLILSLEPKSFDSLSDADRGKGFAGFIAEEADELGLEEWVQRDSLGRPEGFGYAAWPVAQQVVLRKWAKEKKETNATIKKLEASVALLLSLVPQGTLKQATSSTKSK